MAPPSLMALGSTGIGGFWLTSILILDKLLSINDYKSLSFNQFFLVNEINSFNNLYNGGAYKIYNNVNEFKKLMFLGVFLLQILKK